MTRFQLLGFSGVQSPQICFPKAVLPGHRRLAAMSFIIAASPDSFISSFSKPATRSKADSQGLQILPANDIYFGNRSPGGVHGSPPRTDESPVILSAER